MENISIIAKLILGVIVVAAAWYALESLLWGFLIFVAGISIITAIAHWADGNGARRIGTRLLIWCLNMPLLIELFGMTLGYIAGGTGTITGVKLAIMAGLVATAFRWANHYWKNIKGITLVSYAYKPAMPEDWDPNESLLTVISPRKKNRDVKKEGHIHSIRQSTS